MENVTPILDEQTVSNYTETAYKCIEVPALLELDGNLASNAVDVFVGPSTRTTKVVFRPEVSSASSRLRSNEYMGSIRRRRAKKLSVAIRALSEYEDTNDFHVYTHAALEGTRKAIDALDDCPEEGNACEIFRLVRDTLMDGNWDAYRRPDVRHAVAQLLYGLAANRGSVEPEEAMAGIDTLDGLGLLKVPQLLVDVG